MGSFVFKDFGLFNKSWDSRKTFSADVLEDPDYLPVKPVYSTEYSDDAVDIFADVCPDSDQSEEILEDWRSNSSFTTFTLVSETSLDYNEL
jgi:hypothetical protein